MATTERTICSGCFASVALVETEETSSGRLCAACRSTRERARDERFAGATRPIVVTGLASAPRGSRWSRLRAEVDGWCDGRLWWARLPLWIYFAYTFGRHLGSTGPYRSIFDALNLGIHELGHYVFSPFGEFMTTAGGTICQCLAPVLSAVGFYKQRDWFAIAVCFSWLATNFWGVATYVGDARALQLPLVAPGMGLMPGGDGPIRHDWIWMLGELGMLRWDTTIALFFRIGATLTMVAGLVFGAWIMWRMFRRSMVH